MRFFDKNVEPESLEDDYESVDKKRQRCLSRHLLDAHLFFACEPKCTALESKLLAALSACDCPRCSGLALVAWAHGHELIHASHEASIVPEQHKNGSLRCDVYSPNRVAPLRWRSLRMSIGDDCKMRADDGLLPKVPKRDKKCMHQPGKQERSARSLDRRLQQATAPYSVAPPLRGGNHLAQSD